LLEIHRNERCEAVSFREWEQTHEKIVSQTGGWCVELQEVCMRMCLNINKVAGLFPRL